MKNERLERYRQKINIALEKITDIPEQIDDSIKIDATLYRVQIAIDCCMDLIAMLVKDCGKNVADDYTNIHTLGKAKIIDAKLTKELATLNGLRNAIVHKYNTFEEETVTDNITNIQDIITKFLEKTEHEIKTIASNHKKRITRSAKI